MGLDLLVVDANVLIDFCSTERSVLSLVSQHVGIIHVPEPVLAEVKDLDRAAAEALGIRVLDPELVTLVQAANASVDTPLSFQDWLCLMIAEERAWTCVSNDRRLRRECESREVKVLWGLELLLRLIDRKAIAASKGIELAEAICAMNPRMADSVMAAFRLQAKKAR